MLMVLGCVAREHDLRLVALSAVICVLGCWTTTNLLARAGKSGRRHIGRWSACAAALFGCSVWSLHFVAMLAFLPGQGVAYDVGLTALSVVVASVGALAAFLVWKAPLASSIRCAGGGLLLGAGVSGMHYVGVAAMTFSGFLMYDRGTVAASVLVSVALSAVALARASDLGTTARRLEVSGWLALSICGLHFTGMTAITVAPGVAEAGGGTVLGTTTLAIAVGGVSVAILVVGLMAAMIERHLSRLALRDLGRLRLLGDLAQEVLLVHRDSRVIEVNGAGERLFRGSAEDIVGRPVATLFAPESMPALMRRVALPPSQRCPEEMVVRAIDGTHVTVEMTCKPIDYLDSPATVVVFRDLTDRKRDEALIRRLARHDALTDLPNRFNLKERLDVALDVAARQGGALSVVFIDLDRFKCVNDLHGHAVGDALLVEVSRRIQAEIRAGDTLARIGGDEFLMVLTGDPHPERTSLVVTGVIDALCRPFQLGRHRVVIGASAGVALFPQDGCGGEALIHAADVAMYRAKEAGRGTVRFYEAAMGAELKTRLQLGQELAGAAERGELVLHYQPIVHGVTGECEILEALIRWHHPTRGMVPPVEFVPLAEETDLINRIGQWVIHAACREAARWPHPWRVSINVSPRQFQQSDLCETIATAARINGLDPSRLVVEVTEGVLIDDAANAVRTLNRLRDMGIGIALDDFGTGYSSLSYLQLFKFDRFKIDKSFVWKLGEVDDALTLIRGIVNLGHNLGIQVTAEGIETPAQLAALQALGCDQFQGYLVGRPAPIEAFTEIDRLRVKALFGRGRQRLSA